MKNLKKTLHVILGLILIVIGIFGLVLPILNGILFLILGLILISFESPYLEKHMRMLAEKNKRIDTWYEKLFSYMKKIFDTDK